ncbi:predicted protein [Aspergillus terreus NIH2624]|uniref:Uncharacterized protein n=1 Tax=Aspergillus terreus (strain NIH 2624 / FGSC A1156) TaxID=341663 RepID=Q0CKZ2_ASPTN|nr:uncharacterized protein ATEG_05642 [Aspergillus terreus NIH2624]EAU33403.1 predicted protein [Aspergillus terreus NIH2624]
MSRGIPTVADPVWDRIPDDALDDYSKKDSSLSYAELKNDSPWGFVVYRCSYRDNSQWQRMVRLITSSVEESLTLNRRIDLLSRHRLTIMDDATREQRKSPVNGGESSIDVEMTLGTRYNFCLFVDDIALESLDRMSLPTIKLLCRFFGIRGPDERDYVVHPDYEDGETAEEHEDVGWMYTCVVDYCDIYTRLVESSDWYEEYCRPPWLKFCDEDEFPGFWRKKGSKAKA